MNKLNYESLEKNLKNSKDGHEIEEAKDEELTDKNIQLAITKENKIDSSTMSKFFYQFIEKYSNLRFNNSRLNEILDVLINLKEFRSKLAYDNPVLKPDLLKEEIVDKYGYEILNILMEYDSGAGLEFSKYYQEPLFKKWLFYIKNIFNNDQKMVHYAILSYSSSKELIEDLLQNKTKLTHQTIQNLYELLKQNNEYQVQNMDQLYNYRQHRQKCLRNQLVSPKNLIQIQDCLTRILFNAPFIKIKKIMEDYNLIDEKFAQEYLIKENVLNSFDIEIIKSIMSANNAYELKVQFIDIIQNIENLSDIPDSIYSLEKRLKQYYNRKYQECLFKADGHEQEGISYYKIQGIDDDILNIEGQPITNQDQISVVNLEGIPFKILVHQLRGYDPDFSHFPKIIRKDPSKWNNLEGSTTISTAMFSDTYIEPTLMFDDAVYYGFNDITQDSILFMGELDIKTSHGGRKIDPSSEYCKFLLPDIMQTISINRNEIVLEREKRQPNCIICFDGKINDDSKRAAQYFNIPIYMIDKEKYSYLQDQLKNKYQKGQIGSLDIEDIRNILYIRALPIEEKYRIIISLGNQALTDHVIDEKQYLQLLNETRKIMISLVGNGNKQYYQFYNLVENKVKKKSMDFNNKK